jgi:hypothetical protein
MTFDILVKQRYCFRQKEQENPNDPRQKAPCGITIYFSPQRIIACVVLEKSR